MTKPPILILNLYLSLILLGCSANAANNQNPTYFEYKPLEENNMENNGNANVTYVKAVLASSGKWTFHVTVSHPDTGWEDYTNGWDVMLEDGTVLKPDPSSQFTRLLLHPHVDEQPFTRSQSGIQIPNEVDFVIVRAHDLVDGFGGKVVSIDLTSNLGPDYEVIRSR